jgi:uncharacterized protein YndB with AHSA1/START domain
MTDAIVQEIQIRGTAERIFDALTNPDEIVQWWASSEGRFQVTSVESDLRPGGKWVLHATGQGGRAVQVRGEYKTVERPRVLEMRWLSDWHETASETLVRWELEERDGTTLVRLTHSGFATEELRSTYRGWPWIVKALAGYIEKAG